MKNQRLQKWYDDVSLKHLSHELAANKADRLNNIIGFTAIVAGIIAGIEIIDISRSIGNIDPERQVLKFWIAIILASFAIIAALSNAAVKFFGFETDKQKNKSTAVDYLNVKYQLESLLWDDKINVSPDIINKIQQQLSDISSKAPLLKESIVKKIRGRIKENTYSEIPNYLYYDVKLVERWKVNGLDDWTAERGELEEIGEKKHAHMIVSHWSFVSMRNQEKYLLKTDTQ